MDESVPDLVGAAHLVGAAEVVIRQSIAPSPRSDQDVFGLITSMAGSRSK